MLPASRNALLRHLHRLAEPPAGGEPSDQELLQRFTVAGDEAAFAALVRRFGPMVLSLCRRRLANVQDAEDAFQATFLILARRAAAIRRRHTVGAWLFGVATRIIRRAHAEAARRPLEDRRLSRRAEPDPAAELTVRELRRVLDEELSALPERYRAPLVLCYLEGHTQEQAARRLGWTDGMLRGRLERGRAVLRARLLRRGLPASAVAVTAVLAPEVAAVAPALADQAVHAARAFAAGEGAKVSRVAAWAEAALPALTVGKLSVATLLVSLGLLAAGLGLTAAPARLPVLPPVPVAAPAEPAAGSAEQPRLDHLGDPLPPGAVARLGSLRLYVGEKWGDVVILSPDGKLVVATSRHGGHNRLWDAVTGKELPLTDELQRATILVGKDRLLAVNSNELGTTVRDLASGKELHRLPMDLRAASFRLASDGNTLMWYAGEGQGMERRALLRLYHLPTGKVTGPIDLKGGKNWVDYALSADGKTLVTLHGNHMVRVWDVASGQERLATQADWSKFSGPWVLSPDGRILAIAPTGQEKVQLWDTRNLQELPALPNQPAQPVNGLQFSPDGKLLAAYYPDARVDLWDVATGRHVRQIQGGKMRILSVAFQADGIVLVGTEFGAVVLWDAAAGKFRLAFGHASGIVALAFTPDGRTLITGAHVGDATIRRWDALTGREMGRWNGHKDYTYALALSPDGRQVASCGPDRTVRLWDVASGKELRQFESLRDYCNSPTFSPDGRLLAVAMGNVRLCDPATGRELGALGDPGAAIQGIAFSPDGRTLLTYGKPPDVFQLWDVISGKTLRQLHGPAGSANFFPDGSMVVGRNSEAGTLLLWQTASGRLLRTLSGPSKVGQNWPGPWHAAVSPDGRTIAAAYSAGDVRLWEVASAQERVRFQGHNGQVWRVAFSPDGSLLASAGIDRTGLVWDVRGQRSIDRQRDVPRDAAGLAALWADLASTDAHQAYRAYQLLLAAGDPAVSVLRANLRPAAAADPRQIARLVADLDHERFVVRDQATRELRALGPLAQPALNAALAANPPLELRRRLESLLESCDLAKSPRQLREVRAVEVLEHLGTPAARKLLEALAGGATEARLTQEAKAALRRVLP
jgi:RNA polymerase sigma factor (sigma-70 family)